MSQHTLYADKGQETHATLGTSHRTKKTTTTKNQQHTTQKTKVRILYMKIYKSLFENKIHSLPPNNYINKIFTLYCALYVVIFIKYDKHSPL